MRGPTGTRFQRSAQALSRRVGHDILVTTASSEDVYELSGGASAAWLELDAPCTLATLVDRLSAAYRISVNDIYAQIEECMDALAALGVVERVLVGDADG